MLHGQKFSKSRGWYISLRDFLSLFPSDYLRYYLSIITSYDQSDVNFDLGEFRTRINNELIAKIGNFIHRTLSFIWSNYDGKVPKPKKFNELDEKFREEIWAIADEVGTEIKRIELNKGLKKVLDFAFSCNQYFQHKKPWDNKEDSGTCLFLCANAVSSLAILLGPYMPFSAEEVWNQINLKSFREQKWSSASKLTIKSGHKINEPRILFKRIQAEEVEMVKEKLLRSTSG
jgi:methionyl-tRNA synthetase